MEKMGISEIGIGALPQKLITAAWIGDRNPVKFAGLMVNAGLSRRRGADALNPPLTIKRLELHPRLASED